MFFYSTRDYQATVLHELSERTRDWASFFGDMESHLSSPLRSITAPLSFISRLAKHYPRAPFGIKEMSIDGCDVEINEEVVCENTFCRLLHFRKSHSQDAPPIMVIAPLSGHYASLLRRSIAMFFRGYDVYITDWLNPRYIDSSKGDFGFYDFVQYICDFISTINAIDRPPHVVAICQPTAPAMVSVCHLAMSGAAAQAKSLILMGGPVDVRCNPTDVCRFADSNSLSWFDANVIEYVPARYPGAFRRVYPGYIQHEAFINMHPDKHVGEHFAFYKALLDNDKEIVKRHVNFYDTYHAVMDMTAKFFLETLQIVFKEHHLATGKVVFKGNKIDFSAITDVPIMVIEAEFDDICAPGQTKAAFDLCKKLPDKYKGYLFVEKAGHYGVFSGKRWENDTYYKLKAFTSKFD
ncbi:MULTISPECIES: polyhydroxyalkanoate depolymerase [Candidatus Ichthyocystis]|uniref:Putative poly-beta-hydroxyalkanoate depolymerase n=1 Tax=Candidatus Ichthyocystis hellenicum TaxID=1561003 RepID=A0A0S4LZD3_9BURK|nr:MULTISPECIES: polyhydroxyalkanoate depolymerase [Ichthyocystis]CUT16933.1 putative poly-beta-hydroxyalkanoate depolymerase [Candidatus Ichthyocystis hellenicum]